MDGAKCLWEFELMRKSQSQSYSFTCTPLGANVYSMYHLNHESTNADELNHLNSNMKQATLGTFYINILHHLFRLFAEWKFRVKLTCKMFITMQQMISIWRFTLTVHALH